jgi:hypothetical protein
MKAEIATHLRVLVTTERAWFIKRSKTPEMDGNIAETCSFSRLSCLVSMVRNRLFPIQKYFATDQGGDLVITCAEGRRLVRLEVTHDSPVCFSMGRLVGFSEHVDIESYISLSVAAFGCDRNFTYMAWCPEPGQSGEILLETLGMPVALESNSAAFDIKRMLAWSPQIQFSLGELHQLADVFMTQPRVRAEWSTPGCGLLLEPDSSEAKSPAKVLLQSLASVYVPGI